MAELGAAVIGYGLAGEVFHAPLIDAQPRMRVAAVVTSSAERAERARAAYPGVRVVDTAEELFADPGGIDLAVIATPNRTHAALARQALTAGLAVVVDKPFALTADEAQEVIDVAEQARLPLTVFQNRRWDSDFLTLRALIEAGELGRVRRFESRFERWRPVTKGGWREVGEVADGAGILYDLGSHLVDQALTLFGPATEVYCELDRRRSDVQADDDAFIALTHDSGVRSHLWMSAVAPRLGPRMRVLGSERGFLTFGLDPQEDALRAGRRPDDGKPWGTVDPENWGTLGTPDATHPVPSAPGNYPAFYAELAAALLDDAPVPVDPLDAVATLQVLEEARRSAAGE
jgi:predicted dehydrogenase